MYWMAELGYLPTQICVGNYFTLCTRLSKDLILYIGIMKVDAQPTLDKTGQRFKRQVNYKSPIKSGSLLESLSRECINKNQHQCLGLWC